jgi:hypothetical protein
MVLKNFTVICLGLVTTQAAFANPVQVPVEETSPALQLARRVATMENSKDLPSRAVWLGRKVASNARIAYQVSPTPSKPSKKKPISIQD